MNKVPTEVIYHDVSDLPGLLLHVVLAEHIALKPHEQKVGKWGIIEKDFQWASNKSAPVVCELSKI